MADAIPGIARRPEKKGNNHLLVIAIDDYKHCTPLNNAVLDAEAFIDVMLTRYHFEKEHLTFIKNAEATKKAIENAFLKLVKTITPDDNLVVYFSGHGRYDEHFGGNWVPVDAGASDDDWPDYLSNDLIKSHFGRIKSLHTFLIADSCFSGSLFIDKSKDKFSGDRRDTEPSRWGLTSGKKEIVSDGIPGNHSPFAKALLHVLQKAEKPPTVMHICDLVLEKVTANAQQTPMGSPLSIPGHQGGQLVFYFRDDEDAMWNTTQSENTLAAYSAYCAKYRGGKYFSEAFAKMEELEEQAIWDRVDKTRQTALLRFINENPNSPFLPQAQQRYDEISKSFSIPSEPKKEEPKPTSAQWAGNILTPTIPEHMVLIKGTTEPFMMGDFMGDDEYDIETVHPVLLNDFYLSKYALTLGEFKNFITASGYQTDADKDGGSRIWDGKEWEKKSGVNWQCDTAGKIRPATEHNHPVIHVSWNDAIAYCNWLSKLEGLRPAYIIQGTVKPDWTANGYRLPTEAEWEYAAREGGKKVRFGNGKNTADPKEINFAGLKEYKKAYSVIGEYRTKTVPVGSLQCPNALGLHDMSGNVWEWCWDWYKTYPTVLETDPKGPDSGSFRVFRGGSWVSNPQGVRAADRSVNAPDNRVNSIGFRLARTRTL